VFLEPAQSPSVLEGCPKVTAKTVPDPQVMSEYHDLYIILVKICNSCSLPPKKFAGALAACHANSAIIHDAHKPGGPQHGTELAFFSDVSWYMRTLFMKFREVALSLSKLDNLQRKVWCAILSFN